MKEKTPGRLQESADCLRPRGGKAETDDGTDTCPVLLSTSIGLPSYFGHTNLETQPQMRRRPMGMSAHTLPQCQSGDTLLRHMGGCTSAGTPWDTALTVSSARRRGAAGCFLCPVLGRLGASHRAEVACGGDGIASRTLTVPKWRN
jgi:hypothetical protein